MDGHGTKAVILVSSWSPHSDYSSLFLFWQLVIDEDKKFLKLLELLGHYQEKGSVIIFVDKQEHADGLLKDLMKASYPCMSLHGGKASHVELIKSHPSCQTPRP